MKRKTKVTMSQRDERRRSEGIYGASRECIHNLRIYFALIPERNGFSLCRAVPGGPLKQYLVKDIFKISINTMNSEASMHITPISNTHV